ncbi:MAG: hypothetical protein AB1500_07655 [Bacillota bacterium]
MPESFSIDFLKLVNKRTVEVGMAAAADDPEFKEYDKEIREAEDKLQKELSDEGWQFFLDYEAARNQQGIISAEHVYRQGMRDCFALIKELNQYPDRGNKEE